MASLDALEATYDASVKALNIARADFRKSRSAARMAAFIAADEACKIALDAFIAARDPAEVAARREAREARIVRQLAQRPYQFSLFAA